MSHVSKRKMKPETEGLLEGMLSQVFSKLSPAEAGKVISTLLTETEKKMVQKRLGAIFLLQNDYPEGAIGGFLKITPQTISRIKKDLKLASRSNVALLMQKLTSWAKLNTFKKSIKNLLNTPRDKFLRVKKSDSKH